MSLHFLLLAAWILVRLSVVSGILGELGRRAIPPLPPTLKLLRDVLEPVLTRLMLLLFPLLGLVPSETLLAAGLREAAERGE